MATRSILKKDYDEKNDILYIGFTNDRGNSYADEGPTGIEIMRDMDTDDVTGILVYYPREKQEDRQQKIQSMGYDFRLKEMV